MVDLELNPMVPRPFRVERVWWENADTFSFELAPGDGKPSNPFLPGQFNMLYAFGVGEVAVSISGDPNRSAIVLHTTRVVGAVTNALGLVKPGESIGVRGPFGTEWPISNAKGKDVLFVAGGVGMAPLRPAIYHVLSHRSEYGKVAVYYGARTPEDLLFTKEMSRWRAHFDVDVEMTVNAATPEWTGHVGFVTTLLPRFGSAVGGAVAFTCGPEVMMRSVAQELAKNGVSNDNIFVSMERNMKCAVGLCGHCQFGSEFICKDGPVFKFSRVRERMFLPEV